jgi:hypothetical protein
LIAVARKKDHHWLSGMLYLVGLRRPGRAPGRGGEMRDPVDTYMQHVEDALERDRGYANPDGNSALAG